MRPAGKEQNDHLLSTT